MVFTPIEQNRTSQEVEAQIEMLVLEGVLRGGDKLPGERELSKSLNVSRPILRQAIAALADKGLLVTRHGEATLVADVIGTIFAAPVAKLIGENVKAKMDYLEYRREIEGLAAAMAAQRATEADRTLLTRIANDMRAAHAAKDAALEARIDVEFHNAIVDAAHNIVLLHTLRSCYRLLSEDVFFNRQVLYDRGGMRRKLLDQHIAIYDAIMARDANAATETARAHIVFVIEVQEELQKSRTRDVVSEKRLEARG
ncbi:FCD domain-containing protein [Pseudahrensia aquimaris]|uniref:Pyruvate dehydrogenase complex repressor n=1 Tax=Pseudahrensia aquimaris TaxID=744461 RepID=A0ABW3FEG6_9HYPH